MVLSLLLIVIVFEGVGSVFTDVSFGGMGCPSVRWMGVIPMPQWGIDPPGWYTATTDPPTSAWVLPFHKTLFWSTTGVCGGGFS